MAGNVLYFTVCGRVFFIWKLSKKIKKCVDAITSSHINILIFFTDRLLGFNNKHCPVINLSPQLGFIEVAVVLDITNEHSTVQFICLCQADKLNRNKEITQPL